MKITGAPFLQATKASCIIGRFMVVLLPFFLIIILGIKPSFSGEHVYRIQPIDLKTRLTRSCRVEFGHAKLIIAPVDGMVSTQVRYSDKVRDGDVLAEFETGPLERKILEAENKINLLSNRIEQMRGPLTVARAKLIDLEATAILREVRQAEKAYERAQPMVAKGKLSEKRLEEIAEVMQKALERLNASEQRKIVFEIETSIQVSELEHDLMRMKLQTQDLREKLSKASLVSSSGGVISFVEPRLLGAEIALVRAGTHLFSISSRLRRSSTVNLTAKEAENVKDSRVVLTDGNSLQATAEIVRISPRSEAASWDKEQFEVLITFSDPNEEWAVAQNFSCEFSKTVISEALAVPMTYLFEQAGQTMVKVIKGEGSVNVAVETGIVDSPFVQILNGVAFGDQVEAP